MRLACWGLFRSPVDPPLDCTSALPTTNSTQPLQVYFPAALLDQLVSQLGGGGASLAAEAQQVAALLGRVRGAALQQTPVIQQLYAH